MKNGITELLKQVLFDMGVSDIIPEVVIPENVSYGEYSTNVAMRLAKILKKPPMDIALQVKHVIDDMKHRIMLDRQDQSSVQHDQKSAVDTVKDSILQDIESVDVVSPGFVNFKISEATLISQLSQVLTQGEAYGYALKSNTNKKVIVEFTDPNPFKELHVGHLYSNSVGESLSRLFESQGNEVKRADYYGDVGMHAAKSIWGLREQLKRDGKTLEDIQKLSPADRVHYLGQAYVRGNETYEKDIKAAEEMKDINYLVYVSAQDYMKEVSGWQPVVNYRQYIRGKESDLPGIRKLFETGRSWSMEYFESVFQRLGTAFDYYYPESSVAEYGAKTVRDNTPSVFEQSDGATVFRGEKFGLHTRVFINSLGLPTYEAKELGLAQKKNADFPYDHSYIVTGNEINEYFKVLMTALAQINPTLSKKNTHVGHGMVRLPEGKMSSRTGNVLTAEWLLDLVKENIITILDRNDMKYDEVTRTDIAEKATIAAIKYSLLKVSLPSNIAFDLAKSVSFDGDSGPYLLYTYARCKSVLRKANNQMGEKNKIDETKEKMLQVSAMNRDEHAVARLILLFPDVVLSSAEKLAPNLLCTYLFQLAQAFNVFYAKYQILDTQASSNHDSPFTNKELRITLTAATAQVLKNGLYLLGISTVERM